MMKKYKSLLVLVLCLAMLPVLTGCTTSMTYRKAYNLYTTQEYEEAIAIFEQLGDYGESKMMIDACYYELGREAMLEKEWQKAIDYFEKSGYHGAAEKIQECKDKLAQ